jgi:hypothetical protein
MTAILNGQRRPNLSDQINRLDRILDGLADGLNEAVAAAVQVAVPAAVQAATETVLRELFCGMTVLPALTAAMTAPTPTLPSPTRLGNACHWLRRKTVAVVRALFSTARRSAILLKNWVCRAASAAVCVTVHPAPRAVAALTDWWLVAWRMRQFVLVALILGVGVAALGYTAPPEIAALLHGLTVATLAIMVRLLWPNRIAGPADAAT